MIAKIIFIFMMVTSLIASVEPKQRYIVFLKDSEESHYEWLKECLNMTTQHVTSIKYNNTDKNVITDFSIKGQISGYSTWLSPKFVKDELMKRTEIKLVEKDKPVKINYVVPRDSTLLPNLDRIDQVKLPLNGQYTPPNTAGGGTKVFVIDTGITTKHPEFEDRATFGKAFCAGCPDDDDNGHGSHVAGIVAGKTHGVATKANVIGIKVLDATGSGTNADVINGMMFVLNEHNKTDKSIVNMSLGGTFSAAVNTAAKSLTDAGIHLVVAAGNESNDACKSSPSSEKTAITVAASDTSNDTIAFFSNFGACVDIIAPGVNIESVDFQSDGFVKFSGTSQASPHVAGTVALIIAQNKKNPPPNEMVDILAGLSSKGVIKGLTADTLNNFLRVPS